MNLNKFICEYKDIVSSNVSKPLSTKQQLKPTKISNHQYTSIMKTNEDYQKRIFRSTKEQTCETFATKKEFDNFIDNDIKNIKSLTWKMMPISVKLSMSKEFIMNDTTLTDTQKSNYILKIEDDKSLLNKILYDKKTAEIKGIDYSAFLQEDII